MKKSVWLFALLLLTACSAGGPGAAPALLTAEQMQGEYDAERRALELPPGRTWPDRAPEAASAPEGMKFQEGVGEQNAQFVWLCSWVQAAVSEPGRWGDASTQVSSLPGRSLWGFMDLRGQEIHRALISAFETHDVDAVDLYRSDQCVSWLPEGGAGEEG